MNLKKVLDQAGHVLLTRTQKRGCQAAYPIKELLVGLSVGEAWNKINEEEASDFADYLMTEMDNKGKQLSGKPNAVEFTPAIYQNAVVLYLHSKVGYKNWRKLMPLVIPSPTTMNCLLCEMH
jgi:Zn-dependent M16 (insulinase) family peptidase